ncbi:MAG: hypothetical protein OXB98_19205 [Bryobacterales bacterium]|nr:hypothetical protein [Bryobacterales bacterium]
MQFYIDCILELLEAPNLSDKDWQDLDDLSQRLVDGFERVRSFKERRQGPSAASLLDGICEASVTLRGSIAERDANVAFRNAISLRAQVPV